MIKIIQMERDTPMKKRAVLVLILFVLVHLTASCSPAPSETPDSSPESSETVETAETSGRPDTQPAPLEPDTVIHYGTPVIDGILDETYLSSFCYAEEPMENMNYSAAGEEAAWEHMANTWGRSYYLYDSDYLYICTVVHDETICSRGEEWRMNTVWPWNDDGVETYLWFSDEDCMAFHSDAHNIRSVMDVHIWGDNHSSSLEYRDLPREDWCAVIDAEDRSYVTEVRIPLPGYVKAGSMIGTLLEVDDRWAVGEGTENMVGALFTMPRFPGDARLQVELGAR